jgi:Kef-type K+ transport system membrane component KefB
MNIIFAIALLLLIGYFGGRLARRIRLPEVTGYILMGILIGPSCFHLIPEQILEEELDPLVDIALGIIAFSIGGSLTIPKLKRFGKSIIWITLLQSTGAFLLVTISITFLIPLMLKLDNLSFHNTFPFALVLGAIASATAPAATVAVINELKSKGSFTTTLLAVIALDDAVAIALFGISSSIASSLMGEMRIYKVVLTPLIEIVGSLGLGLSLGFLLRYISRLLKTDHGFLIVSLGMVCLTSGTAMLFKISFLLANMALGFMIANGGRRDQRFIQILDRFSPPLYAIFFALAGTYLRTKTLFIVGFLGVVFICARIVGKLGGAFLGGCISRASSGVKKYLGLTLLPQAGVAVGLVLIAHENPAFKMYGDTMINIVLASVVVNELIGPPLTSFAIRHSGDKYEKY